MGGTGYDPLDPGAMAKLLAVIKGQAPYNQPQVEMAEKKTSLNKRAEKEIHVAEVVHHGEKLIVPENMPLASAIKVLTSVMLDEETLVAIQEVVDCFPWEGAIAFRQAVEEQFGYARTIATPSFFGDIPPSEISVDVGVNQTKSAPWGRFTFALADSSDQYLETGTSSKDGRRVFAIGGQIKKKFKKVVVALADRTRQIVKEQSIYRGKALKIDFTKQNGEIDQVPMPKFLDMSNSGLENIVYTRELETLMDVNVLTPLKNTQACRDAKIPLKRGVLLAGPYGTGKTIFARAVGAIAVENSWTYVYIRNAAELPHAIRFAQQYQPCVIFAEDVDRHVTGERTDEMDKILNTLDGIDSKTSEIMVILTTNHLEQVNRAMLRPGRLDVILNVTPPDAEAVTRLIQAYGRGIIEEGADLLPAGQVLDMQTPAIVREAVERGKLMSISRTGDAEAKINGEDLRLAAVTLMRQQELLAPVEPKAETWSEGLLDAVAGKTVRLLKDDGVGVMEKRVEEVDQRAKRIALAVGTN